MENTRKAYLMLDTILKIVSILSASVNLITKAVELLHKTKDKHQKNNRQRQS